MVIINCQSNYMLPEPIDRKFRKENLEIIIANFLILQLYL